jgi:hypothetical protein
VWSVVWLVRTARELNRLGARIPPARWLVALPYWAWRFAEGTRHASARRIAAPVAFALVLVAPIGAAILQALFNSLQTGRASRARSYRRPSRRHHR